MPRLGGLCEEWVEERDDSGNESGCGSTETLSGSTAGTEKRSDSSSTELVFTVLSVEGLCTCNELSNV